jgi:hypothetical protein
MGLKYLSGLQRQFDLAVCTIGSLRCQTEKDYDDFARMGRFMPSQKDHAAFDVIRPLAEAWLLRQLLSESMGLLVGMLEDARSVAEIAQWKAAGGKDQKALKKILDEDRKAYLRLSLDAKVSQLKEKYQISSPHDAFIAGYAKLAGALSRGGTVAESDATDKKELIVRLAVVGVDRMEEQVKGKGTLPRGLKGRLLEVQKRFAVGDKIDFRKDEVLGLFTMIALFSTSLLGALQGFVKKTSPQ